MSSTRVGPVGVQPSSSWVAVAGRRHLHGEEHADPAEVLGHVVRCDRGDRQVERPARSPRRSRGSTRPASATACSRAPAGAFCQTQHRHARRVRAGAPRPTGCCRRRGSRPRPCPGRSADRYGDEPVIARAVHGRREPQADRVHAALDELQREVLRAAARRVRAVERRRVGLGGRPARGQGGDAGGEQERTVAAGQRVADRLRPRRARRRSRRPGWRSRACWRGG